MKSVNIFGVTGGIGYSFLKEIGKNKVDICGFYHSNQNLADRIKEEYSEVRLKRVDLSKSFTLKEVVIPNYQYLLYATGKPHFSKNIFDFSEKDLECHVNININSLYLILQRLCTYDKVDLEKLVIVSSIYPPEINSLYHTVKRLQDEFLEILKPILNSKQIGLSIVKVKWVETDMYKKYMEATGKTAQKVIKPYVVAKCCLKEFEDNRMFNLKVIE